MERGGGLGFKWTEKGLRRAKGEFLAASDGHGFKMATAGVGGVMGMVLVERLLCLGDKEGGEPRGSKVGVEVPEPEEWRRKRFPSNRFEESDSKSKSNGSADGDWESKLPEL